jgi:hypothetical protein
MSISEPKGHEGGRSHRLKGNPKIHSSPNDLERFKRECTWQIPGTKSSVFSSTLLMAHGNPRDFSVCSFALCVAQMPQWS